MQSLSLTVKPITITQGALFKLSTALFNIGAADYSLSISVLGGTLFHNGADIGASGSFSLSELKLGKISFLADGLSLPSFFLTASASGFANSAEVQPILTYKAVNQAPVVSIPGLGSNGDALLKGGIITITRDMISASDAETPDAGNLQVKITTVKGGGFLLNGFAAKSFSLADVDNGSVSFKHDGKLLSPSFSLSVSDSDGKASSVKSTNSATVVFDGSQTAEAMPSNPHEIAVKTPLALTEGATLKLTAKNLPIVVSTDVVPLLQEPTLQLRINTADHCTVMVSGSAVDSFTLAQLKAGLVTLIHDGSQEAPALELSLLNGDTVLDSLHLPFAFKTVNDLPTLSMNSLVLNPGETKLLDLGHFNVADEETPEALEGAYRFAVKSASGIVFHRSGVAAAIKNFSLADVDAGLISISRLSTFVGTPTYALSVADPTGKFSISASGSVLTNHSPQGSVIISGTVSEGQVLTASDTLLDSDAVGSISYTWLDATGNVLGNGAHLTLTQEHVGKQIKVVGSYVDGLGTAEAKASSLSAVVASLNDAPTGYLLIDGNAVLGNTLHAKTDFTDWGAAYLNLADEDGGLGALTFTWKRVNADASLTFLSNDPSYTLTGADVGKSIALSASYTDGEGHVETVAAFDTTKAVVAPGIALSGSPAFQDSLSIDVTLPDAASTATLSYSWKSSPSGAAGTWTQFSTAAKIIPDYTRYGQFISVDVSYTDANGQVHSYTSASQQFDQDLSGSIEVSWKAPSFTASNPLGLPSSAFVWNFKNLENGNLVDRSVTGTSLAVTSTMSDVNLQIAGSNGTTVSSAPIANDPLSGAWEISRSGANLSITKKDMSDADGIRSMFYSWHDANGIEIGNGATFNIDAPYGGTPTKVNTAFKVVVTYADQKGDTDTYTIDDIIIRNHDHTTWDVNPASLVTKYYAVGTLGYLNDADIRVKADHAGEVSVSGQTLVGKILTADTTPITDDDGKPQTGFTYVWEKSRAGDGVIWQTIDGQSSQTLTLNDSLAGYTVRSRVEFKDLRGSQEISYSKATDVVLPALHVVGDLTPAIATTYPSFETLSFYNGKYYGNVVVDQGDHQSLRAFQTLVSTDGRPISVSLQWVGADGQSIASPQPDDVVHLQAICTDNYNNQVVVVSDTSFIIKPPIVGHVTTHVDSVTRDHPPFGDTYTLNTLVADGVAAPDFLSGSYASYGLQRSFDNGATWENFVGGNQYPLVGIESFPHKGRFYSYYGSTYGDSSYALGDAETIHSSLTSPEIPQAGKTVSVTEGANSLTYFYHYKNPFRPNDPEQTQQSTWQIGSSISLTYNAATGSLTTTLPECPYFGTGNNFASMATWEWSADGIIWDGGENYSERFYDGAAHTISNKYMQGYSLIPTKVRVKFWESGNFGVVDSLGNSNSYGKSILGYSNVIDLSSAPINHAPKGILRIIGQSISDPIFASVPNSFSDIDGMGPVTYTWKMGGSNIGTGAVFHPTTDMIGKSVTVEASWTDGLNKYEKIESVPTILTGPVNTRPKITRSLNLDLIDDQWHQITLNDLQGTDAEDGEYPSRLTFSTSQLPAGLSFYLGDTPPVSSGSASSFTLKDIIQNKVWVKADVPPSTGGAGLTFKGLPITWALNDLPGLIFEKGAAADITERSLNDSQFVDLNEPADITIIFDESGKVVMYNDKLVTESDDKKGFMTKLGDGVATGLNATGKGTLFGLKWVGGKLFTGLYDIKNGLVWTTEKSVDGLATGLKLAVKPVDWGIGKLWDAPWQLGPVTDIGINYLAEKLKNVSALPLNAPFEVVDTFVAGYRQWATSDLTGVFKVDFDNNNQIDGDGTTGLVLNEDEEWVWDKTTYSAINAANDSSLNKNHSGDQVHLDRLGATGEIYSFEEEKNDFINLPGTAVVFINGQANALTTASQLALYHGNILEKIKTIEAHQTWELGPNSGLQPKIDLDSVVVFHNETGGFSDILESSLLKLMPQTTVMVNHIADLIYARINEGKETLVIGHSQGGILLTNALIELNHRDADNSMQGKYGKLTTEYHGSAANVLVAKIANDALGSKFFGMTNHTNDAVGVILGGTFNPLSWGLSLLSSPLLGGFYKDGNFMNVPDGWGDIIDSPHTLYPRMSGSEPWWQTITNTEALIHQ